MASADLSYQSEIREEDIEPFFTKFSEKISAREWRKLGSLLGIKDATLSQIEYDNDKNVQRAITLMFLHFWRSNFVGNNVDACVAKLTDALKRTYRNDLVGFLTELGPSLDDIIAERLKNLQSPPSDDPSDDVPPVAAETEKKKVMSPDKPSPNPGAAVGQAKAQENAETEKMEVMSPDKPSPNPGATVGQAKAQENAETEKKEVMSPDKPSPNPGGLKEDTNVTN